MFLGRLDEHKRLPLLLAAFAQVRAALPTARLVIAGPDDKGYLAQLRRVAAELHLTPFVHFPGLVEGATKTALFAQASVCVLPSYSENFGMAVVEALAHARPVVVTEGVDIGPEIAEAGAGLVVPPDAGALAGALLQLLRDPVAAHAMGQRGRAMVETRYNADVVATQMLAVYQQLIQTHS